MAKVKVKVRCLAPPGEALHHTQARFFGRKRYKVSCAASPGAVLAAARAGYTQFLGGDRWRPIGLFRAAAWGGGTGMEEKARH